MKRTSVLVLLAISVAALLLMATVSRSHDIQHPHPYAVASWLASILAFGVAVVMFAEHILYGRRIFLYHGGVFLALGIIGAWDSLTFPYVQVFSGPGVGWKHLAAWEIQWIILAAALLIGLILSGTRKPSPMDDMGFASVIVTSVVSSSVIIFLLTLQPVAQIFAIGNTGMISGIICAAIFAVSCFAYSRLSVHKNNGVLHWFSFGLFFAALAQAAMSLNAQPSSVTFAFAGVMKVFAFMSPLGGMLAEHTRLLLKAKESSADLSVLMQAQRASASMNSPTELFQRIFDLIISSLSASVVCLLPFEQERGFLRVAFQTGLDEETAKQFVFRPSEGPVGDSFSEKAVMVVRDIAEEPVLAQKLGKSSGLKSAIFLPLIVRNECLGVLGIFFDDRKALKLPKDQIRLTEALSDQIAMSMDSFRLHGRMVTSAKATGDYAREMELVYEIGQAVTSKLDLLDLVDTLAEKLKTAVGAQSCKVLVYEENSEEIRIMDRQQRTRHHGIQEHIDHCEIASYEVAQKNEPLMMNDLPNSCHCRFPDMALEDGGSHHVLSVPMTMRSFSGAITVFRQNAEPFDERDKRLLMRLAPIVAVGIRNADLYEHEKKIADSLQAGMLPTVNADYSKIQVSTIYQAALDESLVGGDFYELSDFGNGRYGIALGDVSGKGLDAAVYAIMSRYMIQAYSADDSDPGYVIRKLNTALCRYTPTNKFVTVVYGVIDTESKSFTYVNAGQELPFIYRSADRTLETLHTTGPAVGAMQDGSYQPERVPFNPGDMLILYTDGATEVRANDKFLETEGLAEIVKRNIPGGYDQLPVAIMRDVRTYCCDMLRDDIAIMVVKSRMPGSLF